jgi:hypothetical protein
VRPGPQPQAIELRAAAQLPGRLDELGDVGGQLVEAVQVIGSEAAVQAAAEALGGLGGVLGDVPGDLLGRELARLLTVLGDVVDVELLPQRAYRSGPLSRNGQGTRTDGTACRRASSTRAAVNGSGGGARQPGQRQSVAASRRMTAWK